MIRSITLAGLLIWPIAGTSAADVPFSWKITGKGTGPGPVEDTREASISGQFIGTCESCRTIFPFTPNCVSNSLGIGAVNDMLSVVLPNPYIFPVGTPHVIKINVAAAPAFLSCNWNLGTEVSPGVVAFGPSQAVPCGCFQDACSWESVINVTQPGVRPVVTVGVGPGVNFVVCSLFCGLTKAPACGRGAGVSTLSVTYSRADPNAPFVCATMFGSSAIATDGNFHPVVKSECVAPKGDTKWSCEISGVASTSFVQCRMVADPTNPESGNGPFLIVRATGLKACPPNCPPPDNCTKCLTTPGKTLVDCQESGVCPPGCPPFCPPPLGCPEDPTKCPGPPKCPPYCPPPPGCPENPALCPQGCPPICPPPPECEDDPSKCPEPPDCPPNCAPPSACQKCLKSGKTQGECEASGACPEGCPPKCTGDPCS